MFVIIFAKIFNFVRIFMGLFLEKDATLSNWIFELIQFLNGLSQVYICIVIEYKNLGQIFILQCYLSPIIFIITLILPYMENTF